MASGPSEERDGLSDLLAELTDSDLVIEVVASTGSRRAPDIAQAQRLQEAVEASYRALAGSAPVQIETVAVLEEVARRSTSLWLRVRTTGDDEASQLKFLSRGTLAIIAWMDGSSSHQLADLQQAIRVLAWGTSVTTSAHPVLPASGDLVNAIAAWQSAKESLAAGSSVRISTNNGSADLDLTKSVAEPRTLLQARKLVNHSADMIFVVEMPDYQGSGQWQLKHGGTRTLAYSEPGTLGPSNCPVTLTGYVAMYFASRDFEIWSWKLPWSTVLILVVIPVDAVNASATSWSPFLGPGSEL